MTLGFDQWISYYSFTLRLGFLCLHQRATISPFVHLHEKQDVTWMQHLYICPHKGSIIFSHFFWFLQVLFAVSWQERDKNGCLFSFGNQQNKKRGVQLYIVQVVIYHQISLDCAVCLLIFLLTWANSLLLLRIAIYRTYIYVNSAMSVFCLEMTGGWKTCLYKKRPGTGYLQCKNLKKSPSYLQMLLGIKVFHWEQCSINYLFQPFLKMSGWADEKSNLIWNFRTCKRCLYIVGKGCIH